MPLPNATTKLIQQGHSCNIVVYDAVNDRQTLALVKSASYNENFNIVEAKCLGFFGSVSIDVQDYSCSLSLATFMPLEPRKEVVVPYLDGGTTTIQKLLKTRSEVALTGKGTVLTQIDFIDKVAGVVYNSFNQCIIESNSAQINPGDYVNSTITLRVIERTM